MTRHAGRLRRRRWQDEVLKQLSGLWSGNDPGEVIGLAGLAFTRGSLLDSALVLPLLFLQSLLAAYLLSLAFFQPFLL